MHLVLLELTAPAGNSAAAGQPGPAQRFHTPETQRARSESHSPGRGDTSADKIPPPAGKRGNKRSAPQPGTSTELPACLKEAMNQASAIRIYFKKAPEAAKEVRLALVVFIRNAAMLQQQARLCAQLLL